MDDDVLFIKLTDRLEDITKQSAAILEQIADLRGTPANIVQIEETALDKAIKKIKRSADTASENRYGYIYARFGFLSSLVAGVCVAIGWAIGSQIGTWWRFALANQTVLSGLVGSLGLGVAIPQVVWLAWLPTRECSYADISTWLPLGLGVVGFVVLMLLVFQPMYF